MKVRTLKDTGVSLGLSFPSTNILMTWLMDDNSVEDVEDDNSEDVFSA